MTKKALGVKYIIYNVRKTKAWPYFKKIGFPDFADDAPAEILTRLFQVSQLTNVLYGELEKADQAYFNKHHWPMTNAELIKALNDIRVQDEKSAKVLGNSYSVFHGLYRQ
jgi:hypothetical protein